MRLQQRTYIDREGKATTDSRQGVRLLGPAGLIIDDEVAKAVGLKAEAKPADKQRQATENKLGSKRRTAKLGIMPVEKPKP